MRINFYDLLVQYIEYNKSGEETSKSLQLEVISNTS